MQAFRRAHPLRDTRCDDVASVSRDTPRRTPRAAVTCVVDVRRAHSASITARSVRLWIVDAVDDETQQPQGFPEIGRAGDRRMITRDFGRVDGHPRAHHLLRHTPTNGLRRMRTTGRSRHFGARKKSRKFFRKHRAERRPQTIRHRIAPPMNSLHHPPPVERRDGMMSLIDESAEASMRRHPPREV